MQERVNKYREYKKFRVRTSFWVCFCLATWTSRPWIADSDGSGGTPITFCESTDVSEVSVTDCESTVMPAVRLTVCVDASTSSCLSLKSDIKIISFI